MSWTKEDIETWRDVDRKYLLTCECGHGKIMHTNKVADEFEHCTQCTGCEGFSSTLESEIACIRNDQLYDKMLNGE